MAAVRSMIFNISSTICDVAEGQGNSKATGLPYAGMIRFKFSGFVSTKTSQPDHGPPEAPPT